ncbi:MAG: ORF6N domain-containing protein [Proteobacteria bacterium]|nr:ORF6N domain-containing protein [Pseudomonadota bacterium]
MKKLITGPLDPIERTIFTLRGVKVMLDADLAELYGVKTHRLNEQVKRNLVRFPADFMFQLTPEEHESLISQFAISNEGRGGRRSSPFAFTEHGALMAASVLNSSRAIEISIFVVRAFTKLKRFVDAHQDLADKLAELERKLETHDEQIIDLLGAMRALMAPPAKSAHRIGFRKEDR